MEFIKNDWDIQLEPMYSSEYFQSLMKNLKREYKTHVCFPPQHSVFRALSLTPYSETKAVILGQDPYHTPGAANGLAFSVNEGVPMPPSLKNIYKELEDDLGIANTKTDLTPWARQGLLLLNAGLSVQSGIAMSHKHLNWEVFTDHIIKCLNNRADSIIFVLWGNYARSKKRLIDTTRHFCIESAHPSPLSATRGFFGSRPFSKINGKLREWNKKEIDFKL